jgi:hypothetical protein
MILTQEVLVKINNRCRKYYENLGYNINKTGDKIKVKINDLSIGSEIKVSVKCDVCGTEKELTYKSYIKNINRGGFYACDNSCAQIKNKKTLKDKYGQENYNNFNQYKETCQNKYGVDHFSKTDDFKKKCLKTCQDKYGVNNVSLTKEIKEKLSQKKKKYWYDKMNNQPDIISFKDGIYTLKCDLGENHTYQISKDLLSNRKQIKTILCTICHPLNSKNLSGLEIELLHFIQENYQGEILTNSKKIISPLELDIYLPEKKLALEFNGLWWHNELHKSNNHHLNKTELCKEQGIHLIHIYEDDWVHKKEIIKSRLKNLLGQSQKIYARKCEIKEIKNNKVIREFLNQNHLQGFVGSKVKLGLFYKETLVSLMTFGQKRKVMNSSSQEGEYELLRFCNQKNLNVMGGASKLFKYFLKNYQPTEVISYADRSWSQGQLYKKLEFKYVSKTSPNYYYIIDGIRKHRFNYRKDKLIKEGHDPNKTEHEIMLNKSIYRIYDSGSLKFKLNNEKRFSTKN